MTALLLPWYAPDGVQALVVWLSAIGEARAKKPAGGPWPFYMVTGLPGTSDKIAHFGVYRVHSFDIAHDGVSAMKNAYDAACLADRRVLAFGPPLMPQQTVTLESGLVVSPDSVKSKLTPAWEKYSDDATVERFVAEYDIDWRFIAAA